MAVGSTPVAITLISDIVAVSSKELLDIQATTACRFSINAYVT